MTPRDRADWLLRSCLWLVLGGWVGSWGLFALVIAPVAFRVLTGADQADRIVGPVLHCLHLYGIFAGIALSGLAWKAHRGRALWIAPLVLAGLCGLSEFGITVAIEGVRPHELGPQTAPGAAAQFALLHRISQTIFALVWLSTLALTVAYSRSETPQSRTTSRETPPEFV